MRRVHALVLLTALGFGACATSATPDACTSSVDCVANHACSAAGTCIPVAPLRIVTDGLTPAAVGVPFAQTVQADGGIPGYSWQLVAAESPAWLAIGAASGELAGTPPGAGSGIPVVVAVTDASAGGGQVVQKTLILDISECLSGANEVCHQAEEGRCFEGHRACQAGLWSGCTDLTHSVLFDACGPDCAACDPGTADRCTQGACRCGAEAPCVDGAICCDGACVDAANDPAHCGACGTVCAEQIENAAGAVCHLGVCDYGTCTEAHLNCDGDRSNGCETARDVEHCTYCDDRCEDSLQHALGPVCTAYEENGEIRHRCDYENCELGFYDCDQDSRNGCEQAADAVHCTGCDDDCAVAAAGWDCVFDAEQAAFRCGCTTINDCSAETWGPDRQCCDGACTLRADANNCGVCGASCAGHPAGPVCVDPQTQQCGCALDADCGPGSICCDQACMAIDAENCGACGRICHPFDDQGDTCVLETGDCTCLDDAGCNLRADSAQTCEGEDVGARCSCGPGNDCAGGLRSMCCAVGADQRACVDLLTDVEHCGACGSECAPGQTCEQGVCTCVSGDPLACDKYGPALDCSHDGHCYCQQNPDLGRPCAEGRACCDGTRGGSGGPDGGPDGGCCWFACGQNQPGDCLY